MEEPSLAFSIGEGIVLRKKKKGRFESHLMRMRVGLGESLRNGR